ncbi:MAG: outer membrane beta-barrel protein [Elusimicrobiales bacterium]|jgi:hypothetical protein|nr:outer membrane beta-barrel protein [Elusimicrobiales bacterium]
MKKILFAVLLLCPSFAAAQNGPVNLAGRANITLNISQMDARGGFKEWADAGDYDADVSAGLFAGFNLTNMFELGIGFNHFGTYDTTIGTDKWETSFYDIGAYAKVNAPQIALSADTGLNFYGKIGVGQYYLTNELTISHTKTTTEYDHTGISCGFGGDINFPNFILGIEYQIHRVDYETLAQNVGLNIGYRF